MGASGAHWRRFKVDVLGEGDDICLVPGKLWDERQRLERQSASKGPQSLNYAVAHSASY